jgi:phenylalanyl-tRNA synthetase alpha chain
MKQKFENMRSEFDRVIASLREAVALEKARIDFLGRKGHLASLMKEMGELGEEERREIGKIANEVKKRMEAAFSKKEKELKTRIMSEGEWIDVTAPGDAPEVGHLHPVSQAIAEITDIFSRIGFTRVSAPEVDWDWYAFESLNMPKDHPARDDWETFFVEGTRGTKGTGELGKVVLTPHTSNSQVRELEKGKLPIRMININRCYRRQSDVSHVPMFHQFEGFMVAEGLSVANLKGVLDHFARSFFGPGRVTRLRPHHFRFTEPSFEVDVSCDVCLGHGKTDSGVCRLCKAGWLELGGAGMTHPNVLKAGGIDPERYTAFAFGWGVERTLMMREGIKIPDIRVLYGTDLRFVKQF